MPAGQRAKQSIQGFLGVNLRKDRVTLEDAELAKAINADLHEQPGTIVLRRGRRKQFATALSDLSIRRLALVNGVRYAIAGQSVYRDQVKIIDGTLSDKLFSTMAVYRPLSDTAAWVFVADENGMQKDDGTRSVIWGIDTPAVPIVKLGGVGTGLTGDYLGGYTHLRHDEDAIAHESNIAQGVDTITLVASGGKLAIADMRDAPSLQVTGIGIYRSAAGGTSLLLDSRNRFPTTSTTFSVTHGWEVTAAPGGTVARGLIHHWSVDKSTKRGTQAWEPTATPGLRMISQTAVTGATTFTMPEHAAGDLIVVFAFRSDSTTAPSVPAGWTTWGTGSGGNVVSSVGGYKVATSKSETSGIWTAATGLICQVYRGQRTAGAIGGSADTGDLSTTIRYPALTMTDTASTSLVVGFAGIRAGSSRLETAPTGMVNRSNAVTSGASPATEVAGHDTDSVVSAWLNVDVPVGGGAAGWRARTLEIRGEATVSDTTGVSEDGNGYRGTQLWEGIETSAITLTGSDLVTNGSFSNGTNGWTDISTAPGGFISSTFFGGTEPAMGLSRIISGRGIGQQAITTVVGTRYAISAENLSSVTLGLRLGTTSGGSELLAETDITAFSAKTVYVTATTTSIFIQLLQSTSGTTTVVDSVSAFAVSSASPTPIVTTQTKRWAYASIIADSALGTAAPLDNAVPPKASWVVEHVGHLFLCRDPDNPHHLRWSERFEPERFPDANLLEIGNPDDPLQCIVPIAGIAGVFSKATKYRLLGNTTSNFVAQEAISRRGTPAPLAVIPTERGIVFPSHDGIYLTNLLQQDEEISADIAPLFYGEAVNDLDPINWAVATTFSAAYRRGRYYFAYASGENTSPDKMAVYSRTTGKWYFFDHAARSLYLEDGDAQVLTAGFTDGFVYVLEDGESDADSNIALDCETKDYFGGDPDVRKLFLWARVDADCDDDSLSVDLYVDGDLKRTATLTGDRTRRLIPFPETSMGFTARLGFRYTGTARPRIYGVSLISLPLEFS